MVFLHCQNQKTSWFGFIPSVKQIYPLSSNIADHPINWDLQCNFAIDVRDAFSDLIRAWRNWQPYILNYFDHPVTNAYTESLNSLIRVMDRLGRGYSFEALRAKILFAEGAFKKQLIRPKFERRNAPDYAFAGYAMVDDFASYQQQPQQTEINYGVDISTLVSMIENGEI